MRLKQRIILRLSLILVVIAVALLVRPYLMDWLWRPPVKKIAREGVVTGARVLIIAPHPDDETLGGAGLIQKALAAGKQVKIVVVTCGDGYKKAVEKNYGVSSPRPADYQRLGRARREESLQAARYLGVAERNVIFLGYPDHGMSRLWNYHWDSDRPYRGLNGETQSPYSFSFEPKAPYYGANVIKNLAAILDEYKPTDVVYPDPGDHHPDHWAVNAFIKYTLTAGNYRVKEWTYLVHRGDFPWPWEYAPNLPLELPYALTNLDTRWFYLNMSSQEENRKAAAIRKYITQAKVINSFLSAFVRKNELLGTFTDPVLPVTGNIPAPGGSSGSGGAGRLGGPGRLPYRVFQDPAADTVGRELAAGGDITAVGAVLEGRRFDVGLETRSPVSKYVRYNISMRLFRRDGVRRIDISAHASRLTARKYAGNSLELPAGTGLQVQGNQLWVTLPAGLTEQVYAILINADAFIGPDRIDKTAWRLVRVKK